MADKKTKKPLWQRIKKTEVWFKYNDKSKIAVKTGMVGQMQKMHKDLAANLADSGYGEISEKAPTKVEQTKPRRKPVKKAAAASEGSDSK